MRLAAVALAALVLAAPVAASERHPTLNEVESEVICPVCPGETLDQSDAAIAQRMKRFIAQRIAGGDTKSQIESKLVAQFGQSVLARPPQHGFSLLAWVLPLAGIGLGALAVGSLAWRWTRGRAAARVLADPDLNGRARLDPQLERRLDEELARFE